MSHDFDFVDSAPGQKITIELRDKPYCPLRSDIMLRVAPANVAGVLHSVGRAQSWRAERIKAGKINIGGM